MTTFKMRHLLAAGLCTFGLTANAQFSKTVEQYANADYSSVAAEFTLTEVAAALATDTATLHAALSAPEWKEAPTADNNLFYYVDPADGTTLLYAHNQPDGGFWIARDGSLKNWGSGSVYYAYPASETAGGADKFSIRLGQFPDSLKAGATFTPKFVVKYGGKQATFDITYKVKEVAGVPVPTTVLLSEINVIGSASAHTKRTDIQGYDATALSIDAADLIAKLGLDKSLLGAQLAQMVYAEWRDTELGVRKDSLTNKSTAGAPGWWLQRMLYPQGHAQAGEPSPDLGATAYGKDCHVYIEAFKYDETKNAITCNLGQYPGTPQVGDSVSANIYIIYGDKAYRLNYQVVFTASETQGLASMTSVGNVDVPLTFYDSFADYQSIAINVDIEAVKTALGCEEGAIQLTIQKNEEELWVGNGTANKGGFWVDDSGFATQWSNGASYFEPEEEGKYSLFNVGLHPQVKTNVGGTYPIKIYLVNGSKYYTVSITCTIEHKEAGDQSSWEVVKTEPAVIQVIASADSYTGEQTPYSLSPDKIADMIGTTEFQLYALTHDTIAAKGEKYWPYTKFPCAPAPGVWFNKGGWGQPWAGSEEVPVGICWNKETGAVTIYQVPGKNPIGSTFNGSLFFVNETTGKLYELKITVQFVEALKTAEIVGTESITLPVTLAGIEVPFDLTKAAAALGATVGELADGTCWKGLKSNGLYSEAVDLKAQGLSFLTDGSYDLYGSLFVELAGNEADGYVLKASTDSEVAEDYKQNAKFCAEKGEKIYVFDLTFVSEAVYTGIEDVTGKAPAKDGRMFDLSGRRITKPVKGMYILNNKKYIKTN